jgi:hypothetical protein
MAAPLRAPHDAALHNVSDVFKLGLQYIVLVLASLKVFFSPIASCFFHFCIISLDNSYQAVYILP